MKLRLFMCAVVSVALVAGVSAMLGAAEEGSEAKKLDIVETAKKAGNFTQLVKALEMADLVEDLKGEGPFTVFAPNDAAWEKMPEERRDQIMRADTPAAKEKLAELLNMHVVGGKLMAADVAGMESVSVAAGYDLKIKKQDGKVMIGPATIVKTDIECSNGVIHVIDTVIPAMPGM